VGGCSDTNQGLPKGTFRAATASKRGIEQKYAPRVGISTIGG
jgi:hypothetical protein